MRALNPPKSISVHSWVHQSSGVKIIIQISFLIMTYKKQGYRFENDWTLEHFEKRTFQSIQKAIIIPVDMEIKSDHFILNLEKNRKLLSKASTISVMDCTCKVKLGNCDAPVKTCIDLNEMAERNIRNGISREIDLDELLVSSRKVMRQGLFIWLLSKVNSMNLE